MPWLAAQLLVPAIDDKEQNVHLKGVWEVGVQGDNNWGLDLGLKQGCTDLNPLL